MHFKKVIISVCLLFVYSIGLAHELIPHCHQGVETGEFVSERSEDHQHVHHKHETNEVIDHMDIRHDNHLDTGILDFIFCVLTESDLPASGESSCCYTSTKSNDLSRIWSSKAKFAVLLFGLLTDDNVDDETFTISTEIAATYLSPPLSSAPNRGPPHISC